MRFPKRVIAETVENDWTHKIKMTEEDQSLGDDTFDVDFTVGADYVADESETYDHPGNQAYWDWDIISIDNVEDDTLRQKVIESLREKFGANSGNDDEMQEMLLCYYNTKYGTEEDNLSNKADEECHHIRDEPDDHHNEY